MTSRRLFQYGLNTGGPAVMSVGWIVVSFFSMFAYGSRTQLRLHLTGLG